MRQLLLIMAAATPRDTLVKLLDKAISIYNENPNEDSYSKVEYYSMLITMKVGVKDDIGEAIDFDADCAKLEEMEKLFKIDKN